MYNPVYWSAKYTSFLSPEYFPNVFGVVAMFLLIYLFIYLNQEGDHKEKTVNRIQEDNQKVLDLLKTSYIFLPNDWIILEEVRNFIDVVRISHPYKIKYDSQEIGQNFFFFAYGYIDKKRITIQNLNKYLKVNIEVQDMSLKDPCLREMVNPGWYFLDESGNNRLRLVETVLGMSLYWLKYKKPLPLNQSFRTTSISLNGSTVNVSLNQDKNGTIRIF